MILLIGKLILVPVLLTWTAWIPFLAEHYPTPAAFWLSGFLVQYKNSSLLVTALLAPYLCLIYDTYRCASRRIQFIMGTIFVLIALFSNLSLHFILTEMLGDLAEDWQIVLRVVDKIRTF